MAQEIKQANIFGRLGSNIGRGLSEQLPKEIERYRLSEGLKQFENEAEGLSPLQQYSRLAAIPGITPQMLQTLPEILKYQNQRIGRADQAKNFDSGMGQESIQSGGNASVGQQRLEAVGNKPNNNSSSVTTRSALDATLKPYIPMSQQQKIAQAVQRQKKYPQAFPKFEDALADVNSEDQQNQIINQSLQGQRRNEQEVQSTLQNSIQEHVNRNLQKQGSGTYADIPGEIQERLLNKGIDLLTNPNSKLTEKQVAQIIGKEALDIAKDFSELSQIKSESWLTQSPSSNKSRIRKLSDKFKSRDESEIFTNKLIGQGLTPPYANYLAYPISNNKKINNEIRNLPSRKRSISYKDPEKNKIETERIADKLFNDIQSEDSLFTIALELQEKSYDPQAFMNRIDKLNASKDRLNKRQARELEKNKTFKPSLSDLYLFGISGLDPLVEIK